MTRVCLFITVAVLLALPGPAEAGRRRVSPPGITAFTPASGPVGEEVTLQGSNFGTVSSVSFNGTPSLDFTIVATNQIRAVVPAGATSGPITATNSVGTGASATSFVVDDPPLSEDFNLACAVLPPPWSFTDPLGDSTLEITGVGTANAQLRISVPAGVAHDVWTGGVLAPRAMQPADDTDFDVVAKFESLPTQSFEGQGILVEASPGNLLRFDFNSNGSTLRIFAASFVAGVPTTRVNQNIASGNPLYLRVRRQGNQWTLFRSYDGQSWTTAVTFSHALAVSSVGVFALNAGTSPPAHTAIIDYFFDTVAPTASEDGLVSGEPGPKILDVTVFGNGSVTLEPDLPEYACGQSVTLTALPDPGQFFVGWGGDLSGTTNPLGVVMLEDLVAEASFALDTTPPVISGIQVDTDDDFAIVGWTTNEPATSSVAHGTTTAYELGTVENLTLVTAHSIALTNLEPDTTYHYEITSEDGNGFASSSGDLTFATDPPSAGPLIDAWYGSSQQFGAIGIPQPWVNILGNVSDPNGVSSLSYSLDGGAPRTLSRGPDLRRLADPGDFNADIATSELQTGSHTVLIAASDGVGMSNRQIVTLDYEDANVWPLPYSIDWSTVTDIQDVAQVVDGLWEIQGGAIRTLQSDYDRVVAIGDETWTDYEATVPITIHGFDPPPFNPESGPWAHVGLIFRWPGHTDVGSQQPEIGFFPTGASGIYNIASDATDIRIPGNFGDGPVPKQPRTLQLGVPYVFKFRVETVPNVGGLYSLKVWEEGQAEPPAWDLTRQEGLEDPQQGCILLFAHHVDASFGSVSVTPLGN